MIANTMLWFHEYTLKVFFVDRSNKNSHNYDCTGMCLCLNHPMKYAHIPL